MAENPEADWMPIALIDWYCGEACHRSGLGHCALVQQWLARHGSAVGLDPRSAR
jgi:hypothetical protein